MKFCISFGKFELKYFLYCVLIVIIGMYTNRFVYFFEAGNIFLENLLFHSSFFFLGYLLNIIPAWIIHIKSKKKNNLLSKKLKEQDNQSIEYIYNKSDIKYLSSKDILNFCFLCFFLLLKDLIEKIMYKINTQGIIIEINNDNDNDNYNDNYNDDNNRYDDDLTFVEYITIFLGSKFDNEAYYKHQYISFIILILFEVIKNIYFIFNMADFKISFIIKIILNIIYCILNAICYINIKKLMKYKFISPAKCNFMIGIIEFPLIILIYIIISFTSLGNINNNKYYFDNILELYKNLGEIDAKNMMILISYPFAYGILDFIINQIIYDFTIFHIYIPILIIYFLNNIIFNNIGAFDIIFLIASFLIELIMILIFLEFIEINCCGLNKNLKRNIQSRGIIDSTLAIDIDDDDGEINDERNENINENI